jgi:hypothetical protein
LKSPQPGRKYLRVKARENVFDAETLLLFTQDPVGELSPAPFEQSVLSEWVAWQGQRNVYAASVALAGWYLASTGFLEPEKSVKTLADWRDFWSTAESQSVEGPVRFMGADLLRKLNSEPGRLTPSDFRLRPDSAGFRAGADGKDLGADIDLVGPGEAYERWKQTPEYAEWRKLVAESMTATKTDAPRGDED